MEKRRKRKIVRKILELCILLIVSVVYIISTVTFQLSEPDILFITKFTCEVLRIVLAIGSVILVYNNWRTKMNNRANYIALTSFISSILILFGMKQYIFISQELNNGSYELYKLFMEWIQIMMLVSCIQWIDEESHILKWVVVEFSIACLLIIFFYTNPFAIINQLFAKSEVKLGIRLLSVFLVSILMVINCKGIFGRTTFEEKAFCLLFLIKIVTGGVGVVDVLIHSQALEIVQYIVQLAFMMGVVIYIDGVTMGGTWAEIEIGAKVKHKEAQFGMNEQKTMVTAAEEIKHLIAKMDDAILNLEKVLSSQYGQEGKKYIDKIKNNSNRLLKLSRNIAELHAYELGDKEPHFQRVNLSSMIGEMVEFLETYVMQKGIKLEFIASKEHIEADIDPNAFERIFLNLMSNAVKYNQENGSIKVILSQNKKRVYLCIQDSGIGISNYDMKDIFNKFKRADSEKTRRQEGSGLGLFIVKSLVDLHHGEIQIVSKEGRGTLISISLPLEQARHDKLDCVKREKKSIERNIQVELSDLKR